MFKPRLHSASLFIPVLAAMLLGPAPAVTAADEPAACDAEALQKLTSRVEDLEKGSAGRSGANRMLSDRLLISGRAAAAWFDTGREGADPEGSFRVDEARLFVEALLDENAFLFSEINLTDRDYDSDEIWLGELYINLENLAPNRLGDGGFNLRIGRFDVPFGEEYQHRDAIVNPLISHSLADFWGIDEGIAAFGVRGLFDYVVAVQNGGHPSFRDYDSDKAVIARLGYQPAEGWRVSVSAMRTGDLDPEGDEISEIWFGNGYFRGIGEARTNGTFEAELLQLDIRREWDTGHAAAAVCGVRYDDSLPGDHARSSSCASLEIAQDINNSAYAAVRASMIDAGDGGMPIVGNGPFYKGLFGGALVTDIWRVSLGVGYRCSENIVCKAEYTIEDGENADGSDLDDRNMISAQVAVAF